MQHLIPITSRERGGERDSRTRGARAFSFSGAVSLRRPGGPSAAWERRAAPQRDARAQRRRRTRVRLGGEDLDDERVAARERRRTRRGGEPRPVRRGFGGGGGGAASAEYPHVHVDVLQRRQERGRDTRRGDELHRLVQHAVAAGERVSRRR